MEGQRVRSHKTHGKVPPRFELGSLDSKSRVLTITPQNQVLVLMIHCIMSASEIRSINFMFLKLNIVFIEIKIFFSLPITNK